MFIVLRIKSSYTKLTLSLRTKARSKGQKCELSRRSWSFSQLSRITSKPEIPHLFHCNNRSSFSQSDKSSKVFFCIWTRNCHAFSLMHHLIASRKIYSYGVKKKEALQHLPNVVSSKRTKILLIHRSSAALGEWGIN